MGKLRKSTPEEWEALAKKVDGIREEILSLTEWLAEYGGPKKVWSKDFNKVLRHYDRLKSNLDDRYQREYPDRQGEGFGSDVFYSNHEEK